MTWSIVIKTVGSRSLLPTSATTATVTSAAASTASSPPAIPAAAPRTSSLSSDANSTASESRPALTATPDNVTASPPSILKSDVSDANNLNRTVHSASDTAESNFTIEVDPDDCISSLHDKIESVTGLTAAQQRLIYRGRIINAESRVGPGTDGGRRASASAVSRGNASGNEGHAAASSAAPGALADSGGNTASSYSEDSLNNDDNNTEAAVVSGSVEPERDAETDMATASWVRDTAQESQQPLQPPQTRRRIRDVSGLYDGHTIHLVPRPLPNASSTSPPNGGSRSANIGGILSGLTGDGGGDGAGGSGNVTSLSGADGMSLLAALLGLSGSGGSIGGGGSDGLAGLAGMGLGVVEEETGGASAALGLMGGRGGLLGLGSEAAGRAAGGIRGTAARESELFPRLAPLGGTRRILRRNNRNRARLRARLTEADIRVPDPGTVEPVRQGLMTLHTLLGNALVQQEHRVQNTVERAQESKEDSEEEEKMEAAADSATEDLLPLDSETNITSHPATPITVRSPLESRRQWYRGQWLDALDTVNQWLEATVVDIVLPSDILPHYTMSTETSSRPSNSLTPRRRFRRRTPDAVVSANDLEGRRRLLLEPRPESEDGAEDGDSSGLMDEGFRERDDNEGVQLLLIHYNGWPHRWDEWIRSDSERIRPFRTRTRHRNTNQLASPTPQAVFQAAPATHIMDEDDELERASLLPELQRVITSVNNVLTAAMPTNPRASSDECTSNNIDTSHLPWRLPNHGIEPIINSLGDDSSDVSNQSLATLYRRPDPRSQLDCARLRQLAPLIDRLGRTLTDAAPHIAALADSLPSTQETPSRTEGISGNNIASRSSRSYFGFGDAVNGQRPPSTIDQSTTPNPAPSISADEDEDNDTINDPDLSDYINGMVNTTRGESRSDRTSTRDPIGSSLLASYLSQAASGSGGGSSDPNDDGNSDSPRVIRVGGGSGGSGSGPGIDIHIHAIVTGPGMNSFSLGGFGGGGGAGASPTTATTTTTAIPVATAIDAETSSGPSGNPSGEEGISDTAGEQNRQDDDDHDLFSELYSQSPSPINLHGASTRNDADNDIETEGVLEDSCMSLTQQFVECLDEEGDVEEADVSDRPFSTSFNNDPLDNEGTVTDDDSITQPITTASLAPALNNTRDHSSARASSEHGSARTGTTSLESSATAPLPQTEFNRSPSFTNRLFRRTIGRLSNSNRRRNPSP
mmetsp:Transcript_24367/g.49341  ORF Transcript_24367/g.49341 Transcript_24367/m.49341 type:complete len:1210 (-) Transcript_24367:192-3821(-)